MRLVYVGGHVIKLVTLVKLFRTIFEISYFHRIKCIPIREDSKRQLLAKLIRLLVQLDPLFFKASLFEFVLCITPFVKELVHFIKYASAEWGANVLILEESQEVPIRRQYF